MLNEQLNDFEGRPYSICPCFVFFYNNLLEIMEKPAPHPQQCVLIVLMNWQRQDETKELPPSSNQSIL